MEGKNEAKKVQERKGETGIDREIRKKKSKAKG